MLINSYNKSVSVLFVVFLMLILGFALKKSRKSIPTYTIYATFSDVSGVTKESVITTSGFEIGFVKDIYLNDKLMPMVILNIYNNYKLPTDSSASILSNSLFGSKRYIEITPGGMEYYLKNGDTIEFTQSSIDVIDVVDKYLSSVRIECKK